MLKRSLLLFLGILLLNVPLGAQGTWCTCCFERYNEYLNESDELFYGYENFYEYPYGYALPINRYFNPRPCCNTRAYCRYLENNRQVWTNRPRAEQGCPRCCPRD